MTINMSFLKSNCKSETIYFINEEIISDDLISEIALSCKKEKKVGLDMKNVKAIQSSTFIKFLLEDRFKLFNLQSEVLAYLALILKDGFLKSYVNYQDFSENKRELIKRKFLIA